MNSFLVISESKILKIFEEKFYGGNLKRHLIKLIVLLLVACYATLHPALSVRRSVRQSVCLSVTLFFGFFAVYGLTAPAQMIL